MAITIDAASLADEAGSTGTGSAGTAQQNHTFTTSAAVAAGSMIVILAHKFRSGGGHGTVTGTGGGLTWTTVHSVVSGNIAIYLVAAFAPAGLASGTASVGVNCTANNNDYTVTAASYAGVDTSSTVTAAVRAFGGAAASTAAWSTGVIAGSADDGYIGGCGGDGTLRTNTVAGDNTERDDFNNAGSAGSICIIDDLTGAASDTVAGTWSGTLGHVAIGAAFIPAGGGGGGPTVKQLAALGVG